MNKYLTKLAGKSGIAIKPSHKGELHKELGVPQSSKIPQSKLNAAKNSGSVKLERQAVFAENAKKWRK